MKRIPPPMPEKTKKEAKIISTYHNPTELESAAHSLNVLEKSIQEYIDEGWEPEGGITAYSSFYFILMTRIVKI